MSALASALTKISGQMDAVPERDLRAAQKMNAFFIMPAVGKNSIAGLFSTHPSVDARVAALQRYAKLPAKAEPKAIAQSSRL